MGNNGQETLRARYVEERKGYYVLAFEGPSVVVRKGDKKRKISKLSLNPREADLYGSKETGYELPVSFLRDYFSRAHYNYLGPRTFDDRVCEWLDNPEGDTDLPEDYKVRTTDLKAEMEKDEKRKSRDLDI